jgi:hypothetical protein
METPSNFAKIYFHSNRLSDSFTKPPSPQSVPYRSDGGMPWTVVGSQTQADVCVGGEVELPLD